MFISGERASQRLENSANVYLAYTGAGFLFLAYVLRIPTHYDLYYTRTVGYGVVFLLAALLETFIPTEAEQRFPVLGLLAYVLSSVVLSMPPANSYALLRSVLNGLTSLQRISLRTTIVQPRLTRGLCSHFTYQMLRHICCHNGFGAMKAVM
jgi:hypothetical protein